MEIAFLGLGAMGSRMAKRVLGAGHAVRVYNRSSEKSRALEAVGARRCASPREAAANAEVVISIVTDDAASRFVWLDDDSGALAALGADAVAVESSTLTSRWVRELALHMDAADRAFLDAPVVGSRPQADAGQLTYVVGGDPTVVNRVRPVLELIGGAVHRVGTHGSGAIAKLVVNGLFGIQVAAVAELLAMAGRNGADPDRLVEILGSMPVTSPAVEGVMGAILSKRFDPLFPIDLVVKDFGYVVAEEEDPRATLPTSEAVRHLFERAAHAGLGGDNIHAVAKLFPIS